MKYRYLFVAMMIILSAQAFMAGRELAQGRVIACVTSFLVAGWVAFWFYRMAIRTDFREGHIKMKLMGYEVKTKTSGSPIRQIMCPVFIKGADGKEKEVWCLLDTGYTGWLCLDSLMAKELGLKSEGISDMISANSEFKADRHTTDIRIGGSEFKNVTIQSHPYPNGGRNQYEKGIIGIMLLSQGKFSIEKIGEDYKYSLTI
jgi:predicted aspartyl protease